MSGKNLGKNYSLPIPQSTFIQMRSIINQTLSTNFQDVFGSTPVISALTKLRNDKRECERLLQKVQNLLRDSEKQKNLKHPLVNRKKPEDIKMDLPKSIELVCQKFIKMKSILQTKQQTPKAEKQLSNLITSRMQALHSFFFQILYQEQTQQSAKQTQLNIKHEKSLEELDKNLLVEVIQKFILPQFAKKKDTKEVDIFQANSLVEMIRVISNSKTSDQYIKKEFQKLSKQGKQVLSPLLIQMKRLKAPLHPSTSQINLQNQFKIQNDRIKNLLKQFIKASKIECSQNIKISQAWKKQTVNDIQKMKEQPRNILLSLFEYIIQTKQQKPSNTIAERGVSDKNKQPQKYEKETLSLLKSLQKKEQQLAKISQQNVQLLMDISKERSSTKLKNQRIQELQSKLQVIQKQLKQRDLKNDNYGVLNSPGKVLSRNQAELRKKRENQEIQQRQLNNQLNALKQQLRSVKSQSQQAINKLEMRLKEAEKTNLNSTKDVNQQTIRLKQELALRNQTIQNLRFQIDSVVSQKKDLQRQLSSINEKLANNGENGKSKENLVILALRQNEKINKQNLSLLNKLNTKLNAEVKLCRQELEKLKLENLQKQRLIQTKEICQLKLASIEQDFVKLSQNHKRLNQFYLQTKQELERQQKNRQQSDSKSKEQQIKRLRSQLNQQQLNRKKITETCIKQTKEKIQTIAQLKLQNYDLSSNLQKYTDNSELSKLKNRTFDLQKDVQNLRMENAELKTNIETKEREIISIKIQKIQHRT